MTRRLFPLLLLAAAALITFALIPGSWPDRALLSFSTQPLKGSRSFLAGDGTHTSPYRLQTFAIRTGEKPKKSPTVISIGDDTGQVFQSSPPSPVDFAIILRNLRRLGIDSVAISFPLVWQETDVISLTALDRELDSIPSLATAAPLTRGAVPSPIPPAFRRASIPLSEIHGNPNLLPPVNRLAAPDVVLGNKTALAGFTRIESEPDTTSPFMIAKWGEDRAVLSFLLITVLDHYQIPPSEVKIRLGEYISLGPKAPFLPIDKYGRLDLALLGNFPETVLSMESLLNLETAPETASFQPAILRNDRSITEEASAAYAATITPTISTLCNPTNLRVFSRLPLYVEIIILISLSCIAGLLLQFGKFPSRIVVFLAITGIIIAHFITVSAASIWLPSLPALLIFVFYAVLAYLKHLASRDTPDLQTAPSPASPPEAPRKAVSKQPARNQKPPAHPKKRRGKRRRRGPKKSRSKNN